MTATTVRDKLVPVHCRKIRQNPVPVEQSNRLLWESTVKNPSTNRGDYRRDLYGDTRIIPPASHHKRQRHGFGRDSSKVSATHSTPSPYLLVHFAWEFLSRTERTILGEAVSVYFEAYAHLRQRACIEDIEYLRDPRPAADQEELAKPLNKKRAYHLAIALLRFNFVYPHLIRWLGGVYTYEHRDFDAVFDLIDMAKTHKVPEGYPPVDYERAYKMFTVGAPVESHFQCSFESALLRERYNNHPQLADVKEQVRTKVNKEERLSYYIVLPRSVWAFIHGLGISPMNFILRRGDEEGRVCLDPTSKLPSLTLAPNTVIPLVGQTSSPKIKQPKALVIVDDGAPNKQLPDTGELGRDDTNPSVYYATAFLRYLTWIWRLRMQYPRSEVILSSDDIAAAFHRLIYHPAIAIAYAMVFEEYVQIPTGLVFGAKNSPSLYMIPAELRAHMAAVSTEFDQIMTPLAMTIKLPAPLTFLEQMAIQQATPDMHHQAISVAGGDRPPSFVDDTGNAGIPSQIRTIVNRSLLAAYIIFGFPAESTNPPVINPKKFPEHVLHSLRFLGFILDTRNMTCEWPYDKRSQLADMLDEYWLSPAHPRPAITPSVASRPLGLIRHGAPVSNMGVYHSLRLQHQVNDLLKREQKDLPRTWVKGKPQNIGTQRWWRTYKMKNDTEIEAEFSILRPTLTDKKYEHVWKRPIGLIVKRSPTICTEGDASYGGLGGLAERSRFMWRLSRDDMVLLGIPMFDGEPKPGDQSGTHINILEFMALIISIYFALALSPPGSQPIILATGDNTSALSWMAYAARTKRPIVRRLARLLQALLTYYPYHFALQNAHVKGEDNDTADVLSRFKRAATWRSAIELTSPRLNNCQPYQVPSELLIAMQKVATSEQPGEWYVTKMTELWTVKPVTLPPGWLQVDSMTSLSPTFGSPK